MRIGPETFRTDYGRGLLTAWQWEQEVWENYCEELAAERARTGETWKEQYERLRQR